MYIWCADVKMRQLNVLDKIEVKFMASFFSPTIQFATEMLERFVDKPYLGPFAFYDLKFTQCDATMYKQNEI